MGVRVPLLPPNQIKDLSMRLPKTDKEHMEFGSIISEICSASVWDECWCGAKKKQDGGCRSCQTYQLFWGLGPTCGDSGKPEKIYWSMGHRIERSDEELNKLLDQQEKMREKYK